MTPQHYPYPIPSVTCPDPAITLKLNNWGVQEFFRIEFLLRSPAVWDFFRTYGPSPQGNMFLLLQYGITWDVLHGSHHKYLTLSPAPTVPLPGFSTLTFEELYQLFLMFTQFLKTQTEDQKRQAIHKFQERFLAIFIDPIIPPPILLKALRPVLNARFDRGNSVKFRTPRKFQVKTWIDYLACYDLRMTQGISYGNIAKAIFDQGGALSRDRAEKAVGRVLKGIEAAEQEVWPPQNL